MKKLAYSNATSVLIYLFWAIESLMFLNAVVIMPLMFKSFKVNIIILTLFSGSNIFGNILASVYKNDLLKIYKNNTVYSLAFILVIQKIMLIITAIISTSSFWVLLSSIIFFTTHTISSKLWIEIAKRNQKADPYRQISIMHACSFICFIIFVAVFKKFIIPFYNLYKIMIAIPFGCLIWNIILFTILLKSKNFDNLNSIDCLSNTSDVKFDPNIDNLKMSKQLVSFRVVMFIAGFAIQMLTPSINLKILNESNHIENLFIDYTLYKQIGQAISYIVFSFIIDLMSIYNVFIPLVCALPFMYITGGVITNSIIFKVVCVLFGISIALSQLAWHSSAVVYSRYNSSISFIRSGNILLAIRGIIALFCGYLLAKISVAYVFNTSFILMVIAAGFSLLFIKKLE